MAFDTFERITNMKPCMKRPIIVHAVQVNYEFRVNILEGNYKWFSQGKAGDYLMAGVDGKNYICDKAIFEKTYYFVEGNCC